jgi:2-keto-4-pentenoate hydratase/2-oxohepta-3-ene-1,7-dioic acid hydratase in catechol pathway
MKLAQFKSGTSLAVRLGISIAERLFDIGELAGSCSQAGLSVPSWLLESPDMLRVISRGAPALDEINSLITDVQSRGQMNEGLALDSIEFLPAVNASKILAIGRNYADHAKEGGAALPEAPLLFNKLPNSLNAHNASIVLSPITNKVDYEAELAVVVGRQAKRVSEAEALEHVFGYTMINDVSARDLQFGDGQWTRGKGLDTFAPLGPFITTRDEIRDVQSLKIEGRLNGEVMQSSNTSRMIFKVAYLVSYLSQGLTLEPGDVIATGTPEGVGVFRDPPVLLKAGDVFEVEIEGLGVLRNRVTAV